MAKKSGSAPAKKIVFYNNASQAQSNTSGGTLVAQLNNDIQMRMTRSNTITFTGKVVFHGPNGNAVYGNSQWGSMLEATLANAVQDFLNRVRGQASPEGLRVEPVGFHVDLKVHQPAVAASILTFQVRK